MNIRIFLYLLSFFSAFSIAQPSFDCTGKLTTQEQLICAPENSALQTFDRNLSDLYKASLSINKEEVRANQKQWISKRNQCSDISCLTKSYYSQLKKLSDYLWEHRNEIPECTQNDSAIAYKGMFTSLEKRNIRTLHKYYLSEINFEKASRQGDGSVDLDQDGTTDLIAEVTFLEEGKITPREHHRGIITNLNGCLINIQNVGSFSSPYTGSHGSTSMGSFPVTALESTVKSFGDSSNEMAFNEIKRVLLKENFDTKNLSLLRTYYYTGCAGGSLTDSFLAYDIKLQDYIKVYSRELECGKLQQQSFFYPIKY